MPIGNPRGAPWRRREARTRASIVVEASIAVAHAGDDQRARRDDERRNRRACRRVQQHAGRHERQAASAIRKAKRSALLWKFIADGYRSGNAARRHGLVGRRALQAIDDEHLHGSGRGLELQPELLLQRGKEIRQVRVGSASGRRGRRILHVQIPSA